MSLKPLNRLQATAIFLIAVLIFSPIGVSDYCWMRTHIHLPLWGEVLIIAVPLAFLFGFILLSLRLARKNVKVTFRWFGMPLVVLCVCFSIYASQHVSKPLVLVSLYGFARVHREHLTFISTEKTQPWVVSNGDHWVDGYHLWLLMDDAVGATICFGPVLLLYPILYRKEGIR